MKKKIILTGSTGFLGSLFLKKYEERFMISFVLVKMKKLFQRAISGKYN